MSTTQCPGCGRRDGSHAPRADGTYDTACRWRPQPSLELCLAALREQGWVVAVHNDYRQAGVLRTFWLFTKGDFCARGEGDSDAIAIGAAEREIARIEANHPASRGVR